LLDPPLPVGERILNATRCTPPARRGRGRQNLCAERSEHDTSLATTRAALGEAAFAQSWQAGQALTMWQALEEVKRAEGWEEQHA